MKKEIEKLIPLLNEAAKCFYQLGRVDIWNTNYYADELGNKIFDLLEKLYRNEVLNE